MSFLAELPTPDQINETLAPILGDGDGGLSTVADLLGSIDVGSMSANLSVKLDGDFSLDVDVVSQDLTGNILSELQRILGDLPVDPLTMVPTLQQAIDRIRQLSSGDLESLINNALQGLQQAQAQLPTEITPLVATAAEPLKALKGEFLQGSFGELGQWSEQVTALVERIQPLVAEGPAGLEFKLIAVLQEIIRELIQGIVPDGNLLEPFTAHLDGLMVPDLAGQISALKLELLEAMASAEAELNLGDLSNKAHLNLAVDKFNVLITLLANLLAKLNAFSASGIASFDAVTARLEKQLDGFAQFEIVDVGNIKEKFSAAILVIEEKLNTLDLGHAADLINGVFDDVDAVLSKFSIGKLAGEVDVLETSLNELLGELQSTWLNTVSEVRSALEGMGGDIRNSLEAIGTFSADGSFSFFMQEDIEKFLVDIRTKVNDVVQPLLEQFRTTVRGILDSVKTALETVRDQIESVKQQLHDMLADVHQQLQQADVAAGVESIRLQFEKMLDDLGQIDFDPVIDPVVAAIDDMAASLKKIDISSMNEITIGALKVSAEVVINIDFSAHITGALMAEFDKLVDYPKAAFEEVEEKIEDALAKLARLDLSLLLHPLESVFDPIQAQMDKLELSVLIEPIDAWHQDLLETVDKVSPAAILAPLKTLHADIKGTVATISPGALVSPVQEMLDSTKREIADADLSSLTKALKEPIDELKEKIHGLSPEGVLDPLAAGFDLLMKVLDDFDPTIVLKPFQSLFELITAPLANLAANHVSAIADIFKALAEILDTFDPKYVTTVISEQMQPVNQQLKALDLGTLMVDIAAAQSSLKAAATAADGSIQFEADIANLNPVSSTEFSRLAAEIQSFQNTMNKFSTEPVPASLSQRYDNMRERLNSLLPAWITPDMTPASVRLAFAAANPLALEAEINALYEALKDKVRAYDPRVIQERVSASYAKVLANLDVLDPQILEQKIDALQALIIEGIDAIDVQKLVAEVQGATVNLEGTVDALDPQPVIDQLQGTVDDLTAALNAISPAEVLAELTTPFEESKAIVAEFNPAEFAQPLQSIAEDIQAIVAQIDIGVVLQPLVDKLSELRDELEKGLQRTESAFNGMIKALPV